MCNETNHESGSNESVGSQLVLLYRGWHTTNVCSITYSYQRIHFNFSKHFLVYKHLEKEGMMAVADPSGRAV